jgi:hypothetical protein
LFRQQPLARFLRQSFPVHQWAGLGALNGHSHLHENRRAGVVVDDVERNDKTFGKGFDCFAENAVCTFGVADWHGREAIRNNLRQFIDKGFTAHHDVEEYWDSPLLKVFHGKVGMKFDGSSVKLVRPTMTHFFYMDENEPTLSQTLDRVGRSD